MSGDPTHSDRLLKELWEASRSSLFRSGKVASVLGKIAAHHDTGLIKHIVHFLWDKDAIVVYETAAALSILLQRVPVGQLPDLDTGIRESWPHWEGTHSLDGARTNRLKLSRSWRWAFAALASHPSGFVRQAALAELAGEETGESLPFILLRTTDWVAEVRTAARDIFHRKLGKVEIGQAARCLPLVYRMRKTLRHPPLELFEQIEKLVASHEDDISHGTVPDVSSGYFRYRFSLSKTHGRLSLDELIAKAASHHDTGLKLLACDWLAETGVTGEARNKYAATLLGDKSARVRARAFWRIANANPEKYADWIERGLMDGNAPVQDTARGAWKKLLHRDALSFYREQITRVKLPTAIVSALRGLQAESKLQDEPIVRPFLKHESPRVRREALRILVGWNVPDTCELLREGLQGASPPYSKLAAALLLVHPKFFSLVMVKELLVHPHHNDSRKIALLLAGRMPTWQGLPVILLGYSISGCRDQALAAFETWNRNYNRASIRPTQAEANEALNAFQMIAGTPLSQNGSLLATISYLEEKK